MNSRKTVMIEPEITVTLSLNEKDKENKYKRQFYKLKLERDKIMYLPTIWTIVHEIDKESPLYKYSKKEIAELDGELYILVQYHEESFGQKVYQIASYDFSKMQVDVQYTPSHYFDEEGYTVLDHDKLSDVKKMS